MAHVQSKDKADDEVPAGLGPKDSRALPAQVANTTQRNWTHHSRKLMQCRRALSYIIISPCTTPLADHSKNDPPSRADEI